MRRFIIHIVGFVAAAAAALAAVACDPVSELPVAEFGNCSLRVSFTVGDPATKAVSSTAEWDGDETVSTVQLMLFKHSDGSRIASFTKDQLTAVTSKQFTKTLSSLTVGFYDVLVFVNQPTITATTRDAAKATAITMSSSAIARKSGTTSLGVPSYGEVLNVELKAENTISNPKGASVDVSKLPFRVMLKSLTTAIVNGTPTVNIQSSYLENALMTWTAAGTGNPSGMANKAGRNGSTKVSVASGAEAAYADWTVRDISVNNVGNTYTLPDAKKGGFYAFKNDVTEANDSFNGAFTAESTERTRLVVAATWDGTQCWYPVTIPSPQAGYSYDVSLTITGPGSDDPNKPVVHGNIAITVTVTPWTGGEEINATM